MVCLLAPQPHFLWGNTMMGNALAARSSSFISPRTPYSWQLHCTRDIVPETVDTQLPKGCYREQPMGTPERGPGASELASAPSRSSLKCSLQGWAALLTCLVEKGSL